MRPLAPLCLVACLAVSPPALGQSPLTLADALAAALREARANGRLVLIIAPMEYEREPEPAPPAPPGAQVIVVDQGSKASPSRETGEWISSVGEDLGQTVRFRIAQRRVWQPVPGDPAVSSESSSLLVELGADGRVGSFLLEGEMDDGVSSVHFEARGTVQGGQARIQTSLRDRSGKTEEQTLEHAFGDDATLGLFDHLIVARLLGSSAPGELGYRTLSLGPQGVGEERMKLVRTEAGGRTRIRFVGAREYDWQREVELDPASGKVESMRDLPPVLPGMSEPEGAPARWVPRELPAGSLRVGGTSTVALSALGALGLAVLLGLGAVILTRKRRQPG